MACVVAGSWGAGWKQLRAHCRALWGPEIAIKGPNDAPFPCRQSPIPEDSMNCTQKRRIPVKVLTSGKAVLLAPALQSQVGPKERARTSRMPPSTPTGTWHWQWPHLYRGGWQRVQQVQQCDAPVADLARLQCDAVLLAARQRRIGTKAASGACTASLGHVAFALAADSIFTAPLRSPW